MNENRARNKLTFVAYQIDWIQKNKTGPILPRFIR